MERSGRDRDGDGDAARAAPGSSGVGKRALTDGLVQRKPSGGEPLPDPLRGRLESAAGAGLGGVRVHTGPESAAAAGSVGARAFALGQDIHFGAGEYTPGGHAGDHLIAHEVAHTVQQSHGSAGAQLKPTVSQPGDAAETQADAFADAFTRGCPAPALTAAPATIARTPNANPAPQPPTKLEQQYGAAGATYVFSANVQSRDIPVMTYLSGGFEPDQRCEIVIFFHGNVADYEHRGANNNMTRENPAVAAELPRIAAAQKGNVVVLAPQLNYGKNLWENWTKLSSAEHQAIVNAAFDGIRARRNLKQDVPRGAISIAGHSGGAQALGGAAAAFGDSVMEITFQDAAYDYNTYQKSYQLVRTWMLQGKPGKLIRIITKAATAGTDTRGAYDASRGLSATAIRAHLEKDADQWDIKDAPVKDTVARDAQMQLKQQITLTHKQDGVLQGKIELFFMADVPGKGDPTGVKQHFGVRNAAMEATVRDRHEDANFGGKRP